LDEIANREPAALNMAKQEVRELNDKITDLMEFTRDQSVNLELVVADEIIWRAIEKVKYRPEANRHTITHDGFGEKLMVRVDPKKMAIVLSNLIRNSIECKAEGLKICVSAGKDNGKAYFSVKDDGPGMSKEVVEKVFNPFYTTKIRGFGLGLFLVDLVARAHQGEVRVVETGPTGTEIRMEIPDKS
jgi:signal transduction histidine kinase